MSDTETAPSLSGLARLTRALHLAVPKELRYLAVGVTCAVISNILLIGIVSLGIGYVWGSLIILAPVILLGYALHAAVTFGTRFSAAALLRFAATIVAGQPVWIAILFVLCDVLRLPIVVASPLGTVIMFLLNYVATHWAILRSVRAAFSGGLFGGFGGRQ